MTLPTENDDLPAIILALVRGESPFEPARAEMVAYKPLDIPVSWADIAVGFLHYASVGGEAAYEWASWIIADADSTSLPDVEPEDATVLWGGVWDMAFRGPTPDEVLGAARRLVM